MEPFDGLGDLENHTFAAVLGHSGPIVKIILETQQISVWKVLRYDVVEVFVTEGLDELEHVGDLASASSVHKVDLLVVLVVPHKRLPCFRSVYFFQHHFLLRVDVLAEPNIGEGADVQICDQFILVEAVLVKLLLFEKFLVPRNCFVRILEVECDPLLVLEHQLHGEDADF